MPKNRGRVILSGDTVGGRFCESEVADMSSFASLRMTCGAFSLTMGLLNGFANGIGRSKASERGQRKLVWASDASLRSA